MYAQQIRRSALALGPLLFILSFFEGPALIAPPAWRVIALTASIEQEYRPRMNADGRKSIRTERQSADCADCADDADWLGDATNRESSRSPGQSIKILSFNL